ncbi:PREDICTED: uncharacterized protein LOC109189817 [Ipomoea nil]|uniref:uncharacterized protein LOC109189817 n=1 Tax=Ipomoea nil TaxID=35883 RepID=UPI0009017E83|nr:PREDICTED: uncharacterized protein LOC109189817 [Ipomoea nil]
MSKVKKDREDDQVIRFLDGLNDEYETIKSGALVMDPLPSMEKALNMTLKLERKLNGSSSYKTSEIVQSNAVQNQVGDDQNVVAMTSSNNKKKFNGYGGKNVPKCTYCGMNGHTIDKCFKKHGYPPGWIPGYKSKYKQNQSSQDSQHGFNPSVNQVADVGLSADQFQKLVSLLQNQNQGSQVNQASTNAAITMSKTGMRQEFTNSSNDTKEGRFIPNFHINAVLSCAKMWILDSGATDHITCSLDYIDNYHKVFGIFVKMPNGDSVQVTHIGEIRLFPNLLLKNVLCIPSFAFNIISASKLTKQNGCTLVMNADLCDIQGLHGIMDGFARAKDGLYLLSHPPAKRRQCVDIDKYCNSLSLQMWHNRLGHYPIDKIHSLSGIKQIQFHKPVDFVCDTCHFAKQKRSVFPISNTRAEKCFDLMHLDVWGPFAVASLKREHYFLTIVDDYSRFTWIHLMKTKSEVKQLF